MPTNTSSARSVGDDLRLSLAVASTAGTATNSDITLLVKTPSGAVRRFVSTSTGSTGIDHLATGSYRKTYLSTEAGDYKVMWRSTGVVNQSTSGRWAVRPVVASS